MCILMVMKAIRLYMREDQLAKLRRLSEKSGAPVAELIRRAVDRYLKREVDGVQTSPHKTGL